MVQFVTVWFISYIKLLLCRQTATSFSYSELLKWLLRPEANDIVHINIYQLPPSNRNVCLYLLFWPANSQKPELFSPQIKICTNVKLEPFHPKTQLQPTTAACWPRGRNWASMFEESNLQNMMVYLYSLQFVWCKRKSEKLYKRHTFQNSSCFQPAVAVWEFER